MFCSCFDVLLLFLAAVCQVDQQRAHMCTDLKKSRNSSSAQNNKTKTVVVAILKPLLTEKYLHLVAVTIVTQ